MSTWTSIGGAVCVAVTVVGLLLSWLVWRKKGASRGMRGVAWSLLPLAAYLTHSVLLLGRIVNAVVRFAGAFVFSPKAWAGIVVVGISAGLFLVSGGLPLLNRRKAKERRKQAADGPAQVNGTQPTAAVAARGKPAVTSDDDDLGDIQEILRRRGIK
jgi:hypothetical protein